MSEDTRSLSPQSELPSSDPSVQFSPEARIGRPSGEHPREESDKAKRQQQAQAQQL